MTPDQPATVPAGWYPDPHSVSELRWWDGVSWTDTVHPAVGQQESPQPISPPEVLLPAASPAAEPAAEPAVQHTAGPVHEYEHEHTLSRRELRERGILPTLGVKETSTPDLVAPELEPSAAVAEAHPVAIPQVAEPQVAEPIAVAPLPATPFAAEPPATIPDSSSATSFDWLAGIAGSGPSLGGEREFTAAEPGTATAATKVADAWSPEQQAFAQNLENSRGYDSNRDNDEFDETSFRTSTVSGWFIALMPLFTAVLCVSIVKGSENYPRYIPGTIQWWMYAAGVLVVLYLVTVLLAIADRRKLDWAGHSYPAHWAWAFLTAPIYLIVRAIAVRRETGRGGALIILWVLLTVAIVGSWFAASYFAPELIDKYTLPFL